MIRSRFRRLAAERAARSGLTPPGKEAAQSRRAAALFETVNLEIMQMTAPLWHPTRKKKRLPTAICRAGAPKPAPAT